jgi:hypothetical protein
MNFEIALNRFQERLLNCLIEDIRRTLEVTCGWNEMGEEKRGENNHGSNFIGNCEVLIGIETVSQFLNPYTALALKAFEQKARTLNASLTEEQRTYLQPRWTPAEALGSRLAKKFIREYFDARFKETLAGKPLVEAIWAFRNPHAHQFFPAYQFGKKSMNGAVDWLYKDRETKLGISIEEVESKFDYYKTKLIRLEGDYFRVVPHVLFVYFKHALDTYMQTLQNGGEPQDLFLMNYGRLAPRYGLDTCCL